MDMIQEYAKKNGTISTYDVDF